MNRTKMCFGCGEGHTGEGGLCETCEARREQALNEQDQVKVSRGLIDGFMSAVGVLFAFIMM